MISMFKKGRDVIVRVYNNEKKDIDNYVKDAYVVFNDTYKKTISTGKAVLHNVTKDGSLMVFACGYKPFKKYITLEKLSYDDIEIVLVKEDE
jgi:hypothetical protein